MKSVYDFIVRPIGDRYNNVKKINNKDLVLNTKIESWKFVNRIAEVVSTPLAFNTPIKKNSYFLWFMPYILFVLGGALLYLVIKKKAQK